MVEVNTEKEVSRRSFLIILSGALAGFIAFVLSIPLVASILGTVKKVKEKTFSKLAPINSIPFTTKQSDKPVNLTLVTKKQDAFIKSIEPENAWVVKKSDTDITVFSPICPHLGCRYSWHSEQKLFICPCHNSIFTIDGKLVSGPSLRGLDTLPTKKKDGTLYVLYERFKEGIAQKIVIVD